MKRNLIRILEILTLIIMIFSCIMPNVNYVSAAPQTIVNDGGGSATDPAKEQEEEAKKADEGIDSLGEGIAAILVWFIKAIMVLLGSVVRMISGGIAAIGGMVNGGSAMAIAPEDILFNNTRITDINVFELNSGNSTLDIMRTSVAGWYYAIRNLSIGILLAVLVYIGIRMTLSTVAEQEAKYKKMLMDWLVSFVIVFILHYIIIFTINVNDGFVTLFSNSKDTIMNSINVQTGKTYDNMMDEFRRQAVGTLSISAGLGAAFVFVMLCGLTLIFLFMYIKRMLTISFLIMIAPLITITYSIDKIKDKQAQALNTWIKEFVFNVLIQPFHCVIYLVFGTNALVVMQDGTLGSAILACIMFAFIFKAEDIVRTIFNFQAKSLGSAVASAAILGAGLNKLSQAGRKQQGGGGGNGAPDPSKQLPGKRENLSERVGQNPTFAGQSNRGRIGQKYDSARSKVKSLPGKIIPSNVKNAAHKAASTSVGQTAMKVGGIAKGRITKGRTMGQMAKAGAGKAAKIATIMTGAALGAATGQPAMVMTGMAAGGAASRVTSNKLNEHAVKNSESRLASAYQDYKQAKGFTTAEEMKDKAEELLNADPASITDPENQKFANYLYGMRDIYDAMGAENPEKEVVKKFKDIESGKIQPRFRDALDL